MFFVELDLESSVDLVGRRLRGQLLSPERNHLFDPEETHREVTHVPDPVILTNLLVEKQFFYFCLLYHLSLLQSLLHLYCILLQLAVLNYHFFKLLLNKEQLLLHLKHLLWSLLFLLLLFLHLRNYQHSLLQFSFSLFQLVADIKSLFDRLAVTLLEQIVLFC